MRLGLAGAIAFALAWTAATAADDPMAGYYGNTVISTGGMAEIHTHYRPDHTFDLTGSMMGMSRSYQGTWEMKGDQVCRVFAGEMPPRITNPNCGLLAGPKAVGDTWTVTSHGNTRTLIVNPASNEPGENNMRIPIAAAAVLLCATPALAADDPLASFYGNTVVSTGGRAESRTHFKADHTFDAVFAGGAFVSKGTWELKGDAVCRTYDPPVPGMANPVCVPFGVHKVGDKWTVTVNGQERQVTLLSGIQ